MIDLKTGRRFGAAALLSGAVHAAAITFGWLSVPEPAADLPALAVRIVSPAPGIAPGPPSPPKPRVTRKPPVVASVTATAPQPVMESTPETIPEPPLTTSPAPHWLMNAPVQRPMEGVTQTPQPVLASEAPVAPAEPLVVATAPSSTQAAQPRTLAALPRKGRITYDLLYGRDRFPVGLTVQYWEIEGTRYQLASRSETSGIVDLFRSQHRTYSSRGEVTPDGLRPETFLMSRDRGRGRGTEESRAYFNWSSGRVTLGPANEQREEALPLGSQDLVSFMYQLALDPPPPGRLRLPVTNGTRLETYEADVLPEEKIETPLGVLRVLPLKQVRAPGSEGVDLWLAVEYRHLPVRIRFYGRDGEAAGEQVVTEIRLSED